MGKTVYSYYVMDIVHRGHLIYMENAKRVAGKDGLSIVGILTDEAVMEKKSRPILNFDTRFRIAKSLIYADLIVPQETYLPMHNIEIFRPDVLIEAEAHGEEYIQRMRNIVNPMGIRVIVIPTFKIYKSSTKIKREIRLRDKK